MNKKLFAIIICAVIIIIFILLSVRNEKSDRFNPLLKTETVYGKVSKNTQSYKDITVYTKDGEKVGYKLTFNGYDPDKEYVEVKHKGKYVQHIEYIDEAKFQKIKGD